MQPFRRISDYSLTLRDCLLIIRRSSFVVLMALPFRRVGLVVTVPFLVIVPRLTLKLSLILGFKLFSFQFDLLSVVTG